MVPHDLHHLRELELVGGVGRDTINLQRAKESEGQNREGEEEEEEETYLGHQHLPADIQLVGEVNYGGPLG